MALGQQSPITVPQKNNVLQNFSDEIAGNSMQLYYLMGAQNVSAVEYLLTRDIGLSTPAVKNFAANGDDIDFIITINKPTVLSGRGYIDYGFGASGGAGGASQYFFTFTLNKWDGTNLVEIGQNVSPVQNFSAAADYKYKTGMNLTKTKLNIGDELQLNVVCSSSNYTRTGHFYFDPNTSDKEGKIWIPIRTFD